MLFSTNSGGYVITTCTHAGGDGESGTVIEVTSWVDFPSLEFPLLEFPSLELEFPQLSQTIIEIPSLKYQSVSKVPLFVTLV